MDSDILLDCAYWGVKALGIGTKGLILAAASGFTFEAAQELVYLLSPKIESQEELEEVVEEEALILGLNPDKIESCFGAEADGSAKICEDYVLGIKGNDRYATRATVRHELTHILHDCDKGRPKMLQYFLISEPRAVLYGSFQIRI